MSNCRSLNPNPVHVQRRSVAQELSRFTVVIFQRQNNHKTWKEVSTTREEQTVLFWTPRRLQYCLTEALQTSLTEYWYLCQ